MEPLPYNIFMPKFHFFGTAHGKSKKSKRKHFRKMLIKIYSILSL